MKRDFKVNFEDDLNLDLTPLIDVIFMLVIFFVLTTTFAKPIIDVNLPSSKTSTVNKESKFLTISIKKNGNYEYENKSITLEEVLVLIKDNPDMDLNIYSDREAPFEYFVKLVDVAKELKAGHFVISTNEEK